MEIKHREWQNRERDGNITQRMGGEEEQWKFNTEMGRRGREIEIITENGRTDRERDENITQRIV